jgi:hypothetical protein
MRYRSLLMMTILVATAAVAAAKPTFSSPYKTLDGRRGDSRRPFLLASTATERQQRLFVTFSLLQSYNRVADGPAAHCGTRDDHPESTGERPLTCLSITPPVSILSQSRVFETSW